VQGLSDLQARQNLKTYGFNELPSAKPKGIWHIAVDVMKEPMFLLLISCSVLYIFLGDYREGVIMFSTIFIIIIITFYQSQKTERALEALKKLASPRALVIRNGIEKRIPGREVVPDDVIVLHEGDRIPADARIVEATNLMADESLLTGESVPVLKKPFHTPESEKINEGMVFSGSLIVQGTGVGIVAATGIHSQFGKIGQSLSEIENVSETRLQTEMKSLIRKLFLLGGLISILVVTLFYLTRGNFLQSLLSGLAASMAILPEEFPVVLTVFMALGAWRLSLRHVLTRKPSAIESLGSATVLCADKTGTITQNKMQVAALYHGEVAWERSETSIHKSYHSLLAAAAKASQPDSIDPMEIALQKKWSEVDSSSGKSFELTKEYSFTHTLLAMTRVYKEPDHWQMFTKGAPEAVFQLCKMDASAIEKHNQVADELANQGYRVLGIAQGRLSIQDELPPLQEQLTLNFVGLIGLADPIREEVPAAIEECQRAGIRVVVITGDFPATAKSIARQIGIQDADNLITGGELDAMSDEELKVKIRNTHIFARVVPKQKLRIVNALNANNEIVAMTGDGVNDAPALKAAHIGIAMGNKGTDVAREASSLVLLDDNFSSIVAAIRLGRRIFDNLQKAMSYIMAIHVPIIGLTLLPAFFPSLPILLLPLHIIFMELIIDPVCSVAFEWEQEEKGIMDRPPRNPDERFFGISKISYSLLQGLLLFTMTSFIYFLSLHEGHSDNEVRAIAFTSLILGNMFLILTDLSRTRGVLSVLKERNIPLKLIFTAAFVILISILTIPYFQNVFSFENPGYINFLPALVGSASLLAILEMVKYLTKRKSAIFSS